jgi:hypothetical protein
MILLIGWFAVTALGLPCRAAQPAPQAAKVEPGGQAVVDLVRYLGKLRCPEIVEMLAAIVNGSQMGPGEGWFHPGQSRYSWQWLAQRYGAKPDGRITRKQFTQGGGPTELFDRLDRDGDGVLTAEDFDWSDSSPFLRQNRMADMWFFRLDTNSNGRISRAEWDAFFKKAAKGKDHLTPEDLRAALAMAPPSKSSSGGGGPSPIVFFRGLFKGELGSYHEGPAIGAKVPDFQLPTQNGKKKIRLSDFRGKKPVVLVFGSFT